MAGEIGRIVSLQMEWQLDAVVALVEGPCPPCTLPAIIVRPALRHPWSAAAVEQACADWLDGLLRSTRRAETVVHELPLVGLEELVEPGQLFRRVPERIRVSSQEYWQARNEVLRQCEVLLEERDAEIERLLIDYPFVTATLPHAKRLWDGTRRAPSSDDSVDRLASPRSGPGRPRSFGLPPEDIQLFELLPDGRRYRSPRWDECVAQLQVSPHHWWAQAVVARSRTAGVTKRAAGLQKRASNYRTRQRSGRKGAPGISDVRLIRDYLCPDLAVRPLPILEGPQLRRAVEDWCTTPRFGRLLRVVTGDRLLALQVADGHLGAAVERAVVDETRTAGLREIGDRRAPAGSPERVARLAEVRALIGRPTPGTGVEHGNDET